MQGGDQGDLDELDELKLRGPEASVTGMLPVTLTAILRFVTADGAVKIPGLEELLRQLQAGQEHLD